MGVVVVNQAGKLSDVRSDGGIRRFHAATGNRLHEEEARARTGGL